MAKGIIKQTPKVGRLGSLEITVIDTNPYGVIVGTNLNFADPNFSPPLAINDLVTCTIDSATMCTVTNKG